MVRIVGPGSWAAIVQFFPCRTDNQILHRWKQIQGKYLNQTLIKHHRINHRQYMKLYNNVLF
jgi:hypothetical protein